MSVSERGSAINPGEFLRLGQVLHDGDLAEAILDRVLERGTHFVLRGRSYRTRHLKAQEEPDTEAA